MSGVITSLVDGARNLLGVPDTEVSMLATDEPRLELNNPAALYEFLRDLYYNDQNLYSDNLGTNYTGIQGYRNIAHAVVEFYPATVFPGPLSQAHPLNIPEAGRRRGLEEKIHMIWEESNWEVRKQLYVRWAAMLGDAFLQAAIRRNSAGRPVGAYMAVVDPAHVTNFDTDERGFLNYIRLDIPRVRTVGKTVETYYRTEEWSKFTGRFRRWESTYNKPETPIDDLQGLIDEARLTNEVMPDEDGIDSFGIDFVPFVHAKFIDDGYPRGLAAPMVALLKATEASRMTTELHQKLFRYNQPDLQVVGVARDADGHIRSGLSIEWDQATERDVAGFRRVASLPPGYEFRPIDNRVNYDAHQKAIAELMTHLQETDVPELAWYQRNDANESGKALRIKLVPAISRAEEVRGNLEAELIRAHQMCLTLAQVNRIPGFEREKIGTFEEGAFKHSFEERDVLPLTEDEEAQIMYQRAQTAEILFRIGIGQDFIEREVLKMTTNQIGQSDASRTSAQAAGEAIDLALTRGE